MSSDGTDRVQYCEQCGERLEPDDVKIEVTEDDGIELWSGVCPYCGAVLGMFTRKQESGTVHDGGEPTDE